MVANDLSQRRRAIYTGLRPFLADDVLLKALQLWESKYAPQPSFALQHYVGDICQDESLKGKRAEILRNLIRTMALPKSELLPDPAKTRTVSETSESKPKAVYFSTAFAMLIIAMIAQLDVTERNQMRIDYAARLRKMSLPAGFHDALQRWLSGKGTLALPRAELPLLRDLLNLYYVLMCENLGPVAADRVLAKAVARVQKEKPAASDLVNSLL